MQNQALVPSLQRAGIRRPLVFWKPEGTSQPAVGFQLILAAAYDTRKRRT